MSNSLKDFHHIAKPKIRKCGNGNGYKRICQDGTIGYGFSPQEAYEQWKYWDTYLDQEDKPDPTIWQKLKNWISSLGG